MAEVFTFPTLHVASAITGVGLCEGLTFSRMHQISEAIVGHPIWTHEFAHPGAREAIISAGARLFPLMPTKEEALADWSAAAAKAVAAYAQEVSWQKATTERSIDPLSTAIEVLSGGPR